MGDQYYYSYYFLDISKRGRSTNQPFCISRSSSSSFWVYLGVNLDGLSVTLLGVSTAILAPKGWKIVHFDSINAKKGGGEDLNSKSCGNALSAFHFHSIYTTKRFNLIPLYKTTGRKELFHNILLKYYTNNSFVEYL